MEDMQYVKRAGKDGARKDGQEAEPGKAVVILTLLHASSPL